MFYGKSIILSTLLSLALFAQTAEEIVKKAEDAVKGNSARGTIEMTVTTPDYTRTMKMESWWVGNEKALIVIRAPKKEAGNKTLKIGNEMWNYLKNTETTIKVPPSMMLQSWNGSDFTNDDLVRESNLNQDYTMTLLGKDTVESTECWKIELQPHPDAPVVWGRLLYWVRVGDNLPARIDYFDEKGERIRHLLYSDHKVIGNRKIPTRWVMHNDIKEGRQTEIRLLEMQFDVKISDRVFSFRELERGD